MRASQSHPLTGLAIKTAPGLGLTLPKITAFIGDVSLIWHTEQTFVFPLAYRNSLLPLALCSPVLNLTSAKKIMAPKSTQE